MSNVSKTQLMRGESEIKRYFFDHSKVFLSTKGATIAITESTMFCDDRMNGGAPQKMGRCGLRVAKGRGRPDELGTRANRK